MIETPRKVSRKTFNGNGVGTRVGIGWDWSLLLDEYEELHLEEGDSRRVRRVYSGDGRVGLLNTILPFIALLGVQIALCVVNRAVDRARRRRGASFVKCRPFLDVLYGHGFHNGFPRLSR